MHTNTRTRARAHAHTNCSRNWVLRMEILWEEEGFQFGFKRWQGWAVSRVLWERIPNVWSKAREGVEAMSAPALPRAPTKCSGALIIGNLIVGPQRREEIVTTKKSTETDHWRGQSAIVLNGVFDRKSGWCKLDPVCISSWDCAS